MSVYYDKAKSRWRFEFYKVVDGSRIRTTKLLPKGWTRSQAQAFDREQTSNLYAAATGTHKQRHMIEDAVELYYTIRCPELKNEKDTKQALAIIHGYYAGRYLDELPEVAKDYIEDARAEGLSPATIRNRLAYLRAACNYAYKEHKMGDGPVTMPTPAVNNERHHYATRKQVLSITRKTYCKHTRAIIWMAFFTGMRQGEIMKIGREYPIKDDCIYLYDTKNSAPHIVPLHPRARAAAALFPLPYKVGRMAKWVRRAMDDAGFEHMTFHDLRHSAASAMVNNGVSLHIVGAILNHKDLRSTKRYSHLANKTLAEAIRQIK